MSVAMVAVPVGLRLLGGGVPLHTALLVIFLAPEAFLPLRAAGAQYHASAQGREVLAKLPATTDHSGLTPPDLSQAEIVFDDVSVRSLKNFSLTIEPGERIALVGPSGAGKSTVLGLLLGFVQPDDGRVLVGGVDLRKIDRAQWLEALSWVPQRPTLVPANLSSGEQQRVALAKALDRRHAELFLLDEPTAHLDAETESLVLQATREFTRGRTAVIVAHRPTLLNEVDRVVTV